MKEYPKETGASRDARELGAIVASMRGWSELSDDVTGPLPMAIVAAISAGRPELVEIAITDARRPLYVSLLKLVKVLLETNAALQEHARQLANRTRMLEDNIKGVMSTVRRIDEFANFRTEEGDDE